MGIFQGKLHFHKITFKKVDFLLPFFLSDQKKKNKSKNRTPYFSLVTFENNTSQKSEGLEAEFPPSK